MTAIQMLRLEVLGNENLKEKDSILQSKLDLAKGIYLSLRYPFTRPEISEDYTYWQVMAAKELYNKDGLEGVEAYSENGLSISYNSAFSLLSPSLINMIVPKAGVPE